jgi:hypothetical protein
MSALATPSVRNVRGTGYNAIQTSRLNPQQQQLFSQIFGSISPHLGGAVGNIGSLAAGGTPEMWAQLEAPALRQFEELLGSAATRFGGPQYGTGATKSSGFKNYLTGAAGDLAQQLQSQRLGLQNQAINQLLGLYGNLMGQETFDTGFLPRKKPWWQELIANLSPAIGQGLGAAGSLYGLGKLGNFGMDRSLTESPIT